jgi:hypothetical protein
MVKKDAKSHPFFCPLDTEKRGPPDRAFASQSKSALYAPGFQVRAANTSRTLSLISSRFDDLVTYASAVQVMKLLL